MTATLEENSTTVPIDGGQSVRIDPGQPWPSAYRGSRYSVVSHEDFDDGVLKWEQRDLQIFTDYPSNLRRKLTLLGKEGGYGSIRVTAGNEVLTKVHAENYDHVDQAPVDRGWIPVYVGKLDGAIEFDEVDVDPSAPDSGVNVWRGFPFNHGERWSVSTDGTLVWKWRDYRFESVFDHQELVQAYQKYRSNAGRCYVTEYGHVWVNVPYDDVEPATTDEIRDAVGSWKHRAEREDDTATLRLVNRRLVATSRDDDPSTGHLPIHIGHLLDFDDGQIPTPIVDEQTYYRAVCEYEQVWE